MFSLRSSSLALGASTAPSRTLRLQSRVSARAVANVTLLATMLVVSSGCASLNRKEKGAAIGAAAGGAAGAAVGRANGSTAKGAILGAIVGGAAGAIIGHQMDQQALELKSKIPGATVERVGEGIQVTFASGLMFGFDSTAIRPQAAENLRNLASSLKEYPDTDLLIVGHTDASGTDSYNLDLSSRRARAADERDHDDELVLRVSPGCADGLPARRSRGAERDVHVVSRRDGGSGEPGAQPVGAGTSVRIVPSAAGVRV